MRVLSGWGRGELPGAEHRLSATDLGAHPVPKTSGSEVIAGVQMPDRLLLSHTCDFIPGYSHAQPTCVHPQELPTLMGFLQPKPTAPGVARQALAP